VTLAWGEAEEEEGGGGFGEEEGYDVEDVCCVGCLLTTNKNSAIGFEGLR
jgi:hypothetical protein